MNTILWILQILSGLAFVGAGYSHGFGYEQMKSRPGGQWIGAIPHGLRNFIALSEILGGIGVILPALTGVLPVLTPLAATGLALIMLLAAAFHLTRREYPNIIFNLILFALVAFVAYGRFALVPL